MNPLRPVSTSKEYHASNGNEHDDHGSDPYSFGEKRGGGVFRAPASYANGTTLWDASRQDDLHG